MTKQQAEFVFYWFARGTEVDGETLELAGQALGPASVARWAVRQGHAGAA